MPANPKNPRVPSERNMSIWRKSVVEGCSLRALAEEFKLSPNRIAQIVGKTAAYISLQQPVIGKDWDADRQLRYAHDVTEKKLQDLFELNVAAYKLSTEPVTTTKKRTFTNEPAKDCIEESTRCAPQGDARLLKQRESLVKLQHELAASRAKLPAYRDPEEVAAASAAAQAKKEEQEFRLFHFGRSPAEEAAWLLEWPQLTPPAERTEEQWQAYARKFNTDPSDRSENPKRVVSGQLSVGSEEEANKVESKKLTTDHCPLTTPPTTANCPLTTPPKKGVRLPRLIQLFNSATERYDWVLPALEPDERRYWLGRLKAHGYRPADFPALAARQLDGCPVILEDRDGMQESGDRRQPTASNSASAKACPDPDRTVSYR